MLTKLNHPNIVKIFQWNMLGESMFYSMILPAWTDTDFDYLPAAAAAAALPAAAAAEAAPPPATAAAAALAPG